MKKSLSLALFLISTYAFSSADFVIPSGPGAGMTIETETHEKGGNRLISANGPERCYVTYNKLESQLMVLTSPPSPYPGSIMDLSKSKKIEPENSLVIYSTSYESNECEEMAFSSGKQTLIVEMSEGKPVYTIKVVLKCQDGDKIVTKEHIRKCDYNF